MTAALRFCPRCGTPLSIAGQRFCAACGLTLPIPSTPVGADAGSASEPGLDAGPLVDAGVADVPPDLAIGPAPKTAVTSLARAAERSTPSAAGSLTPPLSSAAAIWGAAVSRV